MAERDRTRYEAHVLRKDVLHASDDEMVVLLGPLALEPGAEARLALEYPATFATPPAVSVRYVAKLDFGRYIAACNEGALYVPPDLDAYPAPNLQTESARLRVELSDDRPGRFVHRWAAFYEVPPERFADGAEIVRLELSFPTDPSEGAYVVVVEWDPSLARGANRFHVVLHNVPATVFPAPGRDDLAEELRDCANLNPHKNGILVLVHPLFVAEQLLRVKISGEAKQRMADECRDAPDDFPAFDDQVVKLIRGYQHPGMHTVMIDVNGCVDESVDLQRIEMTRNELDLDDVLGRRIP